MIGWTIADMRVVEMLVEQHEEIQDRSELATQGNKNFFEKKK